MLKGIDARIGPDLLRALARMGHGDEIVVSDANFPSAAVARHTVAGEELRIDCDAVAALTCAYIEHPGEAGEEGRARALAALKTLAAQI